MADEFIDSSAGHSEVHTPTITNATIDTVTFKYGDGSGKFESNKKVTYPDSADWNIGDSHFTFSGWFKAVGDGLYAEIGQHKDGNNWFIFRVLKTVVQFQVYSGGSAVIDLRKSSLTLDNEWHHVEVSRDGSSGYIFIDGIKQTSLNVNKYNGTFPNLTGTLILNYWEAITNYGTGYYDEVKIDKGICRHTADFTVPSGEDVDNDEYTVLYLKMNSSYTVIENLALSDYVTFTDSIKNNPIKNLVQSLTLSDSRQYSVVKNLLSNLGLIDSRSSSVRKLLNNNIYFTDKHFYRIGEAYLKHIRNNKYNYNNLNNKLTYKQAAPLGQPVFFMRGGNLQGLKGRNKTTMCNAHRK
jgi:hypothetical protein